jgi:formylglycine-generating enzyme required for sulfatase activity
MSESRTLQARTLGDYNLIKQIGQGALGTVFLGEHRFMKKQHILKLLPQELASDRYFIQRFEEEVGLLATLEHPNIVKIHNVSSSQGQYFLIMDCIVDPLGETTNLAQYMLGRNSHLTEDEIYAVLFQLADALDYAHNKKIGGKGLVHRGIKLNNILMGSDKNNLSIALSDFGLSKIIGTGAVLSRTYRIVAEALAAAPVVAVTKPDADRYPNPPIDNNKLQPLHASFLQNYQFLAPEQKKNIIAKGTENKVDIYAFGVLAYYLLVGEFPDGYFDLPSDRLSNSQWNWDPLIRACLANDPAKRPELLTPMLKGLAKEHKYISPAPQKTENLSKKVIEEEIIELPGKIIPEEEKAEEALTLRPIIHRAKIDIPQIDHDPAAIFHTDTGVKQYTPELREIKNIQPILTEMAIINGGRFWRGSNEGNRDEMPRHQVVLPSFAIDKHPVTNEQFLRFLEVMGGEKDAAHQDIIRLKDSRIKRSAGKLSIESGYSKHPVVGVTWYGAIAYAKWVGKRLPTEAEWEIAALGNEENAIYATGDNIEKSEANFFSSDTTAVMSYAPNNYGLFDLAGNVYEWCHDWYGYNYYEISVQEPENPMGPWQGVYRVLRGGCWKSLKEDLRCSKRHRNNPGAVNGTYGFRCAADVE